jgi:hypothetical protein
MSQQDKEDLTNTVTRSLLETDQTDKINFSHQARNLLSAPTSEEGLWDFIKQVQTEKGCSLYLKDYVKRSMIQGANLCLITGNRKRF